MTRSCPTCGAQLAATAPADAPAAPSAPEAGPPVRPRYGQALPKRLHKSPATVSWDQGRWPNFSVAELKCRCAPGDGGCAGEYFHDVRFLDALQRLRDLMDAPLRITSARRCPVRNRRVRGASRSQHMLAMAADIALDRHNPVQLARFAVRAGFSGIGFGATFLHVDMREGREGFHYDNGRAAWIDRFGFDPAERFDTTGKL